MFAVFAAFQLILWSISVLGGFLFLLLLAWRAGLIAPHELGG